MAKKTQETKAEQPLSIDVNEIAKKMAEDIAEFGQKVSAMEKPKNFGDLKLSLSMPTSTIDTLKGVMNQFANEAGKVRQQEEQRVETESQTLEKVLESRQETLKSNLSELKKEAAAGGESAKVVKAIVENNVVSYKRNIEGIQLEKATRSIDIFNVRTSKDIRKTST